MIGGGRGLRAKGGGSRPIPEGSSLRQHERERNIGGGRGIRTPGGVAPTVVFKTTAIAHSAIPPRRNFCAILDSRPGKVNLIRCDQLPRCRRNGVSYSLLITSTCGRPRRTLPQLVSGQQTRVHPQT